MSSQSYAYDMPMKLPIKVLPEEAEACSLLFLILNYLYFYI